ncbi:UDP-N-acetylmuramoyl-L-alanine--D-glutamate ligase, partial [uncultured Sphingomonas sp.]|uniref:UDP-N-acetylmuramoyl-L-alanine--D-glutamate ligase n=1 Tax=uncultured Sphingomonas sp. TaxID=158754 RepID=UPI0026010F36
MILSAAWKGQRYAVLGLARSGLATVRALAAAGAYVVAWDSDPAARERAAAIDGVIVHDPAALDLTGAAGLVVSPGVPLNTHPLVAQARAAGVPVIGDIELFAQARAELPPHKVVGITGTNGKSTTTALVHHILKTAGVPTLMGGNIGLPILEQAPLPDGGVYVLELSSYQIDLTQTLDCDVAVLLNITPDHLDRYDGFEGYAASKARLFAMQSTGRNAVIDVWSASQYDALEAGPGGLVASIIEDVFDFKSFEDSEQREWPALQGPHNLQNARAAVEVCDILNVDIETIRAGLRTYSSLPHRMERVAERNGVAFIDDSKATNPESTAPALGAFERIHWIVGGKRKGDDLDACAPFLSHVVAAYTIGEAAELFADILTPKVPHVESSGDLATAVRAAAAAAQ